MFRIGAGRLVVAVTVGGWWQAQPTGPRGGSFLAVAARTCPAAVAPSIRPTVADTARLLDRRTYQLPS